MIPMDASSAYRERQSPRLRELLDSSADVGAVNPIEGSQFQIWMFYLALSKSSTVMSMSLAIRRSNIGEISLPL